MNEKSRDLKRVRYIASQTLMFFLKERSGNLSYRKLEMLFKKPDGQSEEDYQDICSGAFAKYASGQIRFKNQRLIQKIENNKKYQGAKYLLNHPLWLILENPNATIEQTRKYMRQLDPDTQNRLFKKNKMNGVLERNIWKTYEPFSWVGKNNNLDALACFLMLIREMELLKQWHSYVNAKWYAHELFIRLSHFEPISTLADNIYSLIYHHFINKNQPITSSYFPKEKHRMFEVFKNEYASP